MSRIKTRENVKDIKVIDKATVASERMKTALVRSKDQFENLMDDGQVTPSEYAEDKIRYRCCSANIFSYSAVFSSSLVICKTSFIKI